MTGPQRTRATSPITHAVRLALAGVAVSLGAVALTGHANADPGVPANPTPVPATPGAAPQTPGQPVVAAADAPAPPPPGGPPPVPQIPAEYGQGSSPGPLGFLRDAWHQAHDPYGFISTPPGEMPQATPPPGAGPAPALPPGYISTNAPGSETAPSSTGPPQGAPALPPGYYSKSGPPPPGYFDPSPGPAVPPTTVPGPPTP